jgi:hypothetical protein
LGCFGASKKKKDTQPVQQKEAASTSRSTSQRTEPVKGMELLWQPEVQDIVSLAEEVAGGAG